MKILVADDDPVSRLMLSRLLSKEGHEVILATDGLAAWQILQADGAPRLAILDWMMPGLDGLDLCRRIRSQEDGYIYVILLTSKQEKQDVLNGLAAGADDYLTKPSDPAELKARLRVGQRILELEQTLLKAYEDLKREATHDQLTGLWNRPAILNQYHAEWERSRREGTTLAVLVADIDRFKSINDSYGHLAGDDVLREVARRMRDALRPYDFIGRYGGEEFLILAPNCDEAKALAIAERIRSAVAGSGMNVSGRDQKLPVTISIGTVAVRAADANADADAALRSADLAMYRAKQRGRNCAELAR